MESRLKIKQYHIDDGLSGDAQGNQDASAGDRNVLPYPDRFDSPEGGDRNRRFAGIAIEGNDNPSLPMPEEADEKHIIAAILEGELAGFRILVQRYHKPIYNMVLRATQKVMTAEDLTQEAFTRAYAKLHTFKKNKRFFPWLYTIAVNLCRDHFRRKGIRHDFFAQEPENGQWQDPNADDCSRKPDCVLEVKQIEEALNQMPMRYSEPMLLFYREGFSLKEISDILKISVAAVKVRIYRGRNLLNVQIGGNDDAS